MKANLDFLQTHREKVSELLTNAAVMGGNSPDITIDLNLDPDLMIAFNNSAGHPQSQMVVMQLQTNRRLEELLKVLGGKSQETPKIGILKPEDKDNAK